MATDADLYLLTERPVLASMHRPGPLHCKFKKKKGHHLPTSSGLRPRITIPQSRSVTADKGFTLDHE